MRKLEGRWLEPHERLIPFRTSRRTLRARYTLPESAQGHWMSIDPQGNFNEIQGDFDFDLPAEGIANSGARVARQTHLVPADYIEVQLELPNQEELRETARQYRQRPNVQSERWDLGANQTREVESQNLFEELRRGQNENSRR